MAVPSCSGLKCSLWTLPDHRLPGASSAGEKPDLPFPYAVKRIGEIPAVLVKEIVHGVGARLVIERCPFA